MRIMKELAQTPDGQRRIADASLRLDRTLAELVEKNVKAPPSQGEIAGMPRPDLQLEEQSFEQIVDTVRVEPEAAIDLPREVAIEPEAIFEEVIADNGHGDGMDMGMVLGQSWNESTQKKYPIEAEVTNMKMQMADQMGGEADDLGTSVVYSADAEPLTGDEWPGCVFVTEPARIQM